MIKRIKKFIQDYMDGKYCSHTYGKSYNNYMRIEKGVVDRIGRQHYTLYANCDKCNRWVRVGMIQIHKDFK